MPSKPNEKKRKRERKKKTKEIFFLEEQHEIL